MCVRATITRRHKIAMIPVPLVGVWVDEKVVQ